MKKLLYLVVATLVLNSCTKNIEPWEKEPLNLDVRFVVATEEQHNSILIKEINDGSIGEISFYSKSEGNANLPYDKTINQEVSYYTKATFSYQDRTVSESIAEYESFVAYDVTLKMFVEGELKVETTKAIAKPDDTASISFDFKEYFED
ncbi:hypothetical protein MK851_03845 [Tenacibaculum sp. 1B UA]|uniref:hypothetical protein n=1 Tax=Tenacibaculum sp. 1B UA TaxID=2922252 RepID=UPI002A23CE47|nr:hypothetical protein [Tenacibaculum sp. 1B UA]MDX8552756.1 hypothetical protein [Tenacibaculum sp. 1B UA]